MTKNEFIQQWILQKNRSQYDIDVNREIANVINAIEELDHQFGLEFFEPTEIHSNVDAAIHWG